MYENSIINYFSQNWFENFQLDQHIVNPSMDIYLDNINSILDTYIKVLKPNHG